MMKVFLKPGEPLFTWNHRIEGDKVIITVTQKLPNWKPVKEKENDECSIETTPTSHNRPCKADDRE